MDIYIKIHLHLQSFIFLSLLLTFIYSTAGESWNYVDLGPDVWSDTYPSCAGHSQSPINIRTACTIYQSFTPFHFSSTYNLIHDFTLVNNGHTIIGTYDGNNSSLLKLTGGGLNGTYEFLNFHLHWGENYKSGSEYQVNGIKYAGEIHFVHINPETSKVAVLSVFMQSNRIININETTYHQEKKNNYKIEDSAIEEWKRYFAAAENLQQTNNSTVLSLNLTSLMGGNLNDFWRYKGSLTTPPCTEGIIWTIFKTPTIFTESELGGFRKNIFFEDYRGPQLLYDRVLYRNFLDETVSLISDYKCCSKVCETWNYQDLGPDVWSDTYPSCAGHSQSPINIRTACTIYQSFTPFHFSSTYNLIYDFKLVNNGHTIIGTYNGNDSSLLKLTGGGLNGTYEFVNFHLHWGENYKSGSEHQVNGIKYAGEIHFVHMNPETSNVAVLGVFMQSNRIININETTYHQKKKNDYKTEDSTIEEWKRYFAAAENLQQTNNSTVLSLNLTSLMGGNLNDFWRYKGSLTTPPCTEGIIWTIFTAPTVFTESELEDFRNIFFEDYRGPQPLYDRDVYRNFLKEIVSVIPDYNCCLKNLNYNSVSRLFNQNSFSLVSIEFLSLIIVLCLDF